MKGFGLHFILLIQHFLISRVYSANKSNNFTGLDINIDPTSLKMYDDEMEGLESRSYIDSAIGEWSDKTCLQFREKSDDDEDYMEFVYEVGCSSFVGRIGGRQTISVGNADGSIVCKHGNIVHEVAHSLGFFHEHSRPDRDDYVTVIWDNVEMGYEKNFEKESFETVDSREVDYDYDSVMHYGEFFFTRERGLKTIEPTDSSASIGQRVGLSEKDAEQGNLLYNCETGYYNDKITEQNKTIKGSSDKKLWERPLREREIKVLRKSKVQQHKHKQYKEENHQPKMKEESSAIQDSTVHRRGKKSSHRQTVLKEKKNWTKRRA